MAEYKIFEGGNASNRVTNQMLPSGTNPAACNPPYSYADHQRERSYGVTRRIDLRARKPFGGGGKDQSMVCFFNDVELAVNDELHTHLLLPNSLLFGVSYGITGALAGFTFNLRVKNEALALVNAVDATTAPKNAAGCPLATWVPVTAGDVYAVAGNGLLLSEEDYLTMVITSLPTAGFLPGCGDGGLNMWITAHVLDLDHGNA